VFVTFYFARQANVCVPIIRVGEVRKERQKERKLEKEERKIEHILRLNLQHICYNFFAVLFCFNVHYNNTF